MFTESIAQRDQSKPPREPSSSRTTRCNLAQTRVALHSVKRRCTVGPDGPKTGGSCRQVQPVVATKMIAASTSRSPYLRRPPPCGRVGAGGTTRWNSSHSSSGTKRSTITTQRRLLNPPNETTSYEKANPGQVRLLEIIQGAEVYGVAMRRETPALNGEVCSALKEIMASGDWEQMYMKNLSGLTEAKREPSPAALTERGG